MALPGVSAVTVAWPDHAARVLYVIGSLNVGGNERHLLHLVTRLDRTRFAPMICCLFETAPLYPGVEARGVPCVFLNMRRRPNPLVTAWRVTRGTLRLMRRERVAIVDAYLFLAYALAMPCGWLAGGPAPHQTEIGAAAPGRPTDLAQLDWEVYRREPDADWAVAWRVTEALIRAIRDEAKGLGARFLLAPVPGGVELATPDAIVKVFPGYRAEEYDLAGPRERLRWLVEAEGMDYTSIFDALAADRRARNGKLEDYFFWCDGHLTPRAHDIVARAIAQHLRGRPAAEAVATQGPGAEPPRSRSHTVP